MEFPFDEKRWRLRILVVFGVEFVMQQLKLEALSDFDDFLLIINLVLLQLKLFIFVYPTSEMFTWRWDNLKILMIYSVWIPERNWLILFDIDFKLHILFSKLTIFQVLWWFWSFVCIDIWESMIRQYCHVYSPYFECDESFRWFLIICKFIYRHVIYIYVFQKTLL